MTHAKQPGRRAFWLVAMAPLALAGCISLCGKAPPMMLRLTPAEAASAGPLSQADITSALAVLDPETDRSLDVLRVPVRVNGSSIAYLKDAVWVERPGRQFRAVVAETIRAKSGRLVVEGGEFQTTAASVLSGRLLDMGYDAQAQAVVVRFDAILRNRDGSVRSQRFEAREGGVAPKVDAVGPALNRTANAVAQQVAAWVGA